MRGAAGTLSAGLALAATPTFAIMALLDTVSRDGGQAAHCADSAYGSALSGMTTMYLLMAAFHLPAWFGRGDRR